jgi:predicted transcriptional regulator
MEFIMTKRAFGELENAILHILRDGKRMSVKEVQSLLKSGDKYNTIMTVMLRLAEKGALARERVGAHYEYWLNENKKPSFLQQLKQKMFGIKTVEMVSYLIDKGEDITDEELNQMEKLIQQAKQKRKSHE